MIVGKNRRKYAKDWRVVIHLVNDNQEQICKNTTKDEATSVYNEAITQFKDNKQTLEIKHDGCCSDEYLECFNKKNIVSIELRRY